ncbi:fungal-specific transcription factor domain-containing protein [Multifurca ochricompacta]|uniref:Fungal-specific transcription factor domain-containing protein n=1 Tax=Multifurca ochricompacta TaxID=376703 RepID=A0AAD4M6T7_9AGAM|nr:fungal-specific transcription factor domain-containing protein [Multifurca ochricompacta]
MTQSPIPIPDDPHSNAGNSSPSDFHSSVETSPAIIPLSEPPASDGGHSPSSTSTRPSFQHRNSLDLQRSVSTAGRGGCWTCRLRRKKCDEQREEGDSCRTCRRLQLNCLGWGPRRPDWMRDKEAVQTYKMEIKAHLLRLGLIRGQPRTSLSAASSTPQNGSSLVSTTNSAAAINRARSERGSFQFSFDDPQPQQQQQQQQLEFSFPQHSRAVAIGLTGAADGGGPPSLPPENFSNVPGAGDNFQWAMQPTGLTDQDAAVKREHLAYYFNHVRGLHFLFTCKVALDAIQAVVTREPMNAGALTDAMCAIASRQYAKAQRRASLPDTNLNVEDTQSQLFFNQGAFLLDAARRQGRCTQAEAMAAIHLISYSLAERGGVIAGANARVGGTDWTPFLELACDWLAQTGMHVDENPRLFIMNLPLPAAYSAKVTMCMDIFMGVTLQQPPRLLALYRRLLTATGTPNHIWGGSSGGPAPEWELYVPLLVGCTEQVLLAFAEIAALAHWKAHEARDGKLSARELIMRGNVIERAIRQTTLDPMAFEGSRVVQVNEDTCRRILATILQESALLYLNMVLSGNNPGVPEIQSSLNHILNLLKHMPLGKLDLGLALPLAFAGFMADTPTARDTIHKRLRHVGSVCGSANIRQIEGVMLEVWARRDSGQREVEWREVMQERGLTLLMI